MKNYKIITMNRVHGDFVIMFEDGVYASVQNRFNENEMRLAHHLCKKYSKLEAIDNIASAWNLYGYNKQAIRKLAKERAKLILSVRGVFAKRPLCEKLKGI